MKRILTAVLLLFASTAFATIGKPRPQKQLVGALRFDFLKCLSDKSIRSTTTTNPLVKVFCGEYVTSFLKDDGTVWVSHQNWPAAPVVMQYTGLPLVRDGNGGQYHTVAITRSDSSVYILGNTYTSVSLVPNDQFGRPFTGIKSVVPFYQANLALRNDSIYYWGIGDPLNQNGGSNITNPKRLTQPTGKQIDKLVVGGATDFNLTRLWGLAKDGTLWEWTRSSTTPTQVTIAGKTIADITMVGAVANFVRTTDNKFYGWGYYSTYVGTGSNTWTPTDVTSVWTSAGVTFPIKEMVGNYNTLHIIDANDNMFAAGCNTHGEVGNNNGFKFWKTKNPWPWQAAWANGEDMVSASQIPGKYKNIQTSNTITFYLYVQDMGDNWYSWGRNKATSLGNDITLPASGGNDYAIYPNAKDVHAPTRVNPLDNGTWTIETFEPNGAKAPLTWPGINQYLTDATSTTLTGSASQQQPTSTTTVTTSFAWSKQSGPSCTITSPTSGTTTVTGLQTGTYVFRLTSTSTNGLSSYADVVVENLASAPPPCSDCLDDGIIYY